MAKKIPVLSTTALKQTFGDFSYKNIGGGRIEIDPTWVRENIVDCVLVRARAGQDVHTKCHEKAKEPFERAFQMIAEKGMSGLIKTYDGLWVPRHQLWKNSKPLSRHSWGVAVDLNAQWNAYGDGISPENLALNEVFNLFGFAWGGDWGPSERDAMHWELADVEAWKRVGAVPDERKDLILAIWRSPSPSEEGWSYHRLQKARLVSGRFQVDRREVAALFNRSLSAGTSPIRDLLTELGQEIVKTSDLLNDPKDPRLYLFVRPVS